MKILTHIVRFIVGILFIFSGFIKLNDPLGFSYKLQEYFSPEVLSLEFLSPYALLIAIILVIVEILLGIALLIGHRKKIVLWLLLAMIAFFTFLTFYSAYFNKVTDCGCFGDAIPLVPWESFAKDVILLVLIVFLILHQKFIQPAFAKMVNSIIIFIAFIACMAFGYYVLMHLPWLDFRAYKVGNNISEGMIIPEGAPEAIFEYQWKFNVDGEEEIITTSGGYPTVKGTFIDYEVVQTQVGYIPPVHDFTIERDGKDYTSEFLKQKNLIIIIAYNLATTEREGYYNIRKISEEAIRKGYKVIGLSSSAQIDAEQFAKNFKLPFSFYYTDETVLKTIVRASPGILSLDEGTILQKLHYNDASDLKLKKLPTAQPKLNFKLKRELDSIAVLDQKYRKLMHINNPEKRALEGKKMGLEAADYTGDLWQKQLALDTSNLKRILRLLDTQGYPGKSLVGVPTNTAAWYVIQHNPEYIEAYLPIIKEAGMNGEIPYKLVAMMEDRYLMNLEKMQLYGTQGVNYGEGPSFIWPIKNSESVNDRRKDAGFSQTIESYATDLFGNDFQYESITLEEALRRKNKSNNPQ
ncbi:BT_3928 family protein [Dokdonia sp. Hel_I_53]|uniref:BT_3928 family protein n=1 Tax=Dokdonia sp. Hel_I_53 TaxID=1566287 RepID=UPI0011990A47|nr:BT_3928 family protein [Dokdonia sp. Hel_I_53]TVZ53412.1 putative membrane protein YphA (DoxX/SURF4 family) [Dokdonia sp. Hel_I_53]